MTDAPQELRPAPAPGSPHHPAHAASPAAPLAPAPAGSLVIETHEVTNQVPPYADVDLWAGDVVLREAVARDGAGGPTDPLAAFGKVAGSAAAAERARLADRNPPQIETHDARGFRIDQVVFHPAWHETMAVSPSRMSSPESETFSFFRMPDFSA